MKMVDVEKSSEEKRRYTHWQWLIEEFHKSRREVWKMYRQENSKISNKEFVSIVNAVRGAVKRSGYAISVIKRGNDIYLIKVIKIELVDI